MATGGREFAFVGEGVYDIWYPYPKKFATKCFITYLGSIRGLLSHIKNLL